MSEATKTTLAHAEEQLALAKAAVAESTAKREEARAAFDAIEQKRRSLARAVFLGSAADTKSSRAAANARDDAQKIVEDMNLVVDEAQQFLNQARGALIVAKFKDHWEALMELGRRRAQALEKVMAARDALYAAAAEFMDDGQRIIPHAARAQMLCPHGAMGVIPSQVALVVGNDWQKLALIIADTMPNDLYMHLPKDRSFGRSAINAVEQERRFWEMQEIAAIDPAPMAEAAA